MSLRKVAQIITGCLNTGWNDKIVSLENTTWFHFCLMKTGFLFFVADHLLVGQLCTIPTAIGAFYHVWKWHNVRRARSEMRRCITLPMLSTNPGYDSQNHCWIATNNRDVPRVMKTKFPATVIVFGVVLSEGHIMHPHIFKVGLKVNTKVYLDVLKSVVIPWCNQVLYTNPSARAGYDTRSIFTQSGGRWQTLGVTAGPQVQRDPGLASEGVLRRCTLLSLPLFPRPEPAGLLRLVIRREYHEQDLPQHQSQPGHRHPPGIRRAPAGACGKGMLPVPDPYRGGDWGSKRLHWIDVSSTT